MIALSPEAEAQLDTLIAHYEALGRVEASINLLNALERCEGANFGDAGGYGELRRHTGETEARTRGQRNPR